MTRHSYAALLLVTAIASAPLSGQQTRAFSAGMIVSESVTIEPGRYQVAGAASLGEALIVVRGSDVVLDLSGVTLQGIEPDADPDLAVGVAIRVDGGSNITIRGGVVRGYRFGLLARDVQGLHVIDGEWSYNWKPRLFSQIGHESLVDWLSYHNNEEREWMRFGAGIYLENVTGGEIRGNRSVQGMNGLLMTYSDDLVVSENNFSFNSGLGIGMYHSSSNTIVRNRMDFDVRGYSEGFYERGQDSAGLLMYAQSSNNVVAYNSATHSGDGFFLWAGQRTMDTGEGGANDNLLFYNDFSYAPTNAVEVTFSRNRVVANYLRGSRYGIWGGYSWETVIQGNCFAQNRYGVAIEHGQDNVIEQNRFSGDSLVISLWARESEPADWGYARERDTRSRDHRISGNLFAGNAALWRLERTNGHDIGSNRIAPEIPDSACDPRELLGAAFDRMAPPLPGIPREIPESVSRGLPRSAIVVDDWGPYDGLSPKLWPTDTASAVVELAVLGPPGAWSVVGQKGLSAISAQRGRTGDTLVVEPDPEAYGDWAIDLQYVGEATTSARGVDFAAGASVAFRFERFHPTGMWDVSFYDWSNAEEDPSLDADAETIDRVFAKPGLFSKREARLDYQWYTPDIDGLPLERWAAEATTTVDLEAGDYSIRTISDDGIRVWVDGEIVIDHYAPHGSLVDYAPISAGRHDIRVRYFQIGGWSELRVDVIRGHARSVGSAGPH